MNSHAVLIEVLNRFPMLKKFSKALPIENAIKLAIELASEKTESMHCSPGARLKALRGDLEISQLELSILARTSQGNLSAIETARRPMGVKMARRFAKVLECDFRELL